MLSFSKRSAVIALAAAAAVGMGAAPALADGAGTDQTNVTLTAGALTITAPTVADFGSFTLAGAAHTMPAAVTAFSVNDATGSGAGWNVTVQATQLAEWDAGSYVASGKTLPVGSLSLTASTVSQVGTSSPVPAITVGPYLIDEVTAVQVASAAATEGMGEYAFTATTLTLSVPASAYARTYRSDVTVSVVTGP